MRIDTEIYLEDIDLDKLQEAKKELIQVIWSNPKSLMWHLLYLVDKVQQKSIEKGLWKLTSELEGAVVRKSDKLALEPEEGELCWDVGRSVGMERIDGKWVDVSYEYWVNKHGGQW